LQWIKENHLSNEIRQLSHELSTAFVTFGAVKDNVNNVKDKKILIEEIEEQRDLREESFVNAWTCLQDASLPIRAHGLIVFRRLIERADRETLMKFDDEQLNLFERIHQHLRAEDSYEYLAAINVFNALANRHTDKVLPILCHEYVHERDSFRQLEDQLKVGEVLVRTSRLLGKNIV
jgi:hypothetical protein